MGGTAFPEAQSLLLHGARPVFSLAHAKAWQSLTQLRNVGVCHDRFSERERFLDATVRSAGLKPAANFIRSGRSARSTMLTPDFAEQIHVE